MKIFRRLKVKKAGLLAFFLMGAAFYSTAQDSGQGKPIIVLFGDYTAGLGKNNDVSGFNLTRSRLGYEYQAPGALKATVVLDINAFDNDTRTVNFHYAMLEWTYKKLTLSGGLVYLSQFEVQEAFWGKRYIEKSYQDRYGFGHDSDLGIKIKYNFTDWLNADFAVTNGEGTLDLNNNNTLKYGLGFTVKPATGLTLRVYTDVYSDSPNLYPTLEPGETASYKSQRTIALFAGYSNNLFSLGAEYNNQSNREFVNGCDYDGYSVYASVPLAEKLGIYGRYDYVDMDSPNGITYDWSSVADNKAFTAGIEYQPLSCLSVSPNYRYAETLAGDGRHAISLNVGFIW